MTDSINLRQVQRFKGSARREKSQAATFHKMFYHSAAPRVFLLIIAFAQKTHICSGAERQSVYLGWERCCGRLSPGAARALCV